MPVSFARHSGRKSRRGNHRMGTQGGRRKLFLEALEERRMLAGIESSLVNGPWALATGASFPASD